MPDDGLKRIKLSVDYAGQKAGSIYVCDPVRAAWIVENDRGREAAEADLNPRPKPAEDEERPVRRYTRTKRGK